MAEHPEGHDAESATHPTPEPGGGAAGAGITGKIDRAVKERFGVAFESLKKFLGAPFTLIGQGLKGTRDMLKSFFLPVKGVGRVIDDIEKVDITGAGARAVNAVTEIPVQLAKAVERSSSILSTLVNGVRSLLNIPLGLVFGKKIDTHVVAEDLPAHAAPAH